MIIATFAAIDYAPEIRVEQLPGGTFQTSVSVAGEFVLIEENIFRAVAIMNAALMWTNGSWRYAYEQAVRESRE